MVTEPNKTLEALKIAIRMEIDGKAYYLKLSKSSDSQAGRELFRSLAAEEDIHRKKFEEIYDAISSRKAWPKIGFEPGRVKRLRTIFAGAAERLGSGVTAPATEFDALKTAMDMETRSYDLYKSRAKIAAYVAEREFYQALASEEREHHLSLLDYYEYMNILKTQPGGLLPMSIRLWMAAKAYKGATESAFRRSLVM